MASLAPAGSHGTLLVILLFQLLNTAGWCQIAHVIGLCSDCKELKKDLAPRDMAPYSNDNTNVLVCHSSIIRFKLRNNVLCGKSSEDWVARLKQCIDSKEFLKCRRKVPQNPALAPAPVATMSASAAPTPAFVLTTTTAMELATRPTSTPENPHFTEKEEYKITLEPKKDEANETNNDALAAGERLQDELKNSTPSPQTDKMKHLTIAVLSLLAVVFALVGLVTYMICRRKARQKAYEEVNQTLETDSL